jgi:ubiquitin carboxyl-terminal hydrolase 14
MDKEVTFVTAGIMKGLEGHVEMTSSTLGVPANFSKISRVARLPRYLVVGFNRFDSKTVKQTGPGDSDKVVGLKILKPVTFPFVLDVYQLCSGSLKAEMDVERRKLEDIKEAELAAKQATGTLLEQRVCDLSPDSRAAELERLKQEKMGQESGAPAEEAAPAEPMEVDSAPGEENSTQAMDVDVTGPLGYYDLYGVVTHKGRALSSGHYQGWVKTGEKGTTGQDQWLQYDDDEIIERTPDDILKLCGGGDWDTAYLAVYKTRNALP